MNERWFKEDRLQGATEAEIAESKKAILNSTIVLRRLRQMFEEDLEKTYAREEDFSDPNWERNVLTNVAERKTIKRYLKLLP